MSLPVSLAYVNERIDAHDHVPDRATRITLQDSLGSVAVSVPSSRIASPRLCATTALWNGLPPVAADFVSAFVGEHEVRHYRVAAISGAGPYHRSR